MPPFFRSDGCLSTLLNLVAENPRLKEVFIISRIPDLNYPSGGCCFPPSSKRLQHPGPTDRWGISPIAQGSPLPKRDGPWESIPATAECCGGVKPCHRGRGLPLASIFKFPPSSRDFLYYRHVNDIDPPLHTPERCDCRGEHRLPSDACGSCGRPDPFGPLLRD